MSIHSIDAQTQVRLLKGTEYPAIQTGDVLVLASIFYQVDLTGGHLKLTKIKENNPSEDHAKAAKDVMEADLTPAGVVAGRLKKHPLSCPHSDVSGTHATIFPDKIVDASTNGTFIIYHNRNTWVKVPADTGVRIGDVELSFN